jgi:hypothetical protein
MAFVQTPARFRDGFTDFNRPPGTEGRFQSGGIAYYWYPHRGWSTTRAQLAAPGFPAVRLRASASAQLSAKELLDYEVPPNIPVQHAPATVSASSLKNRKFALINQLVIWSLPQDLRLYTELPTTKSYYPPNHDQSLVTILESDAIAAMRQYVIGPVSTVMHNRFPNRRIDCLSEHSSTVDIVIPGVGPGKVVSRVDMCWRLYSTTRSAYYVFALLEFKRPGSILREDWLPALYDQPVEGNARLICQQLCKYAVARNLSKVAVCDFNVLILLNLHGQPRDWKGQVDNGTFTGASFRWIQDRNEMKRQLYIFLIEGANEMLGRVGETLP